MSSTGEKIEEQANEEVVKKIDFKMVTFSLADKEYGIDIMKIKEISKVEKFTYVPNTQHFVRGVHNLRGEIISIIDLRKMFHLPEKEKPAGTLEDVIILKLSEIRLGVVVDKINQVIGISSESIQPAPPIFSDINIKYISGVVEYNDNLYIILDVERIFMDEEETDKQKLFIDSREKAEEEPEEVEAPAHDDAGLEFMTDSLRTFSHFFVTAMNESWVMDRLVEWKKIRSAIKADFQLKNEEEADQFLSSFYSPYTGMIWDKEYKDAYINLLPGGNKPSLNVWNIGCGKGYEPFSLACLSRLKYPKARIKIWANDKDLLDVSNATRLVLTKQNTPKYLIDNNFVRPLPSGYEFAAEVKDLVFFEYHDVLSNNTIPLMDLIVARDVFSFFDPSSQSKIIEECWDKLAESGILVVGSNEYVEFDGFKLLESGPIRAYQKV
ncbi:MAG: chemotaxis protein CheW [Spirochaetales bacterium]|nr:chemotaxis protein CheW [Spirochaetales bacterium]